MLGLLRHLMVRILFVVSCIAFFAIPSTAEAQLFRRGVRNQPRRFQQPPAYRPPSQNLQRPRYTPPQQQPPRNSNYAPTPSQQPGVAGQVSPETRPNGALPTRQLPSPIANGSSTAGGNLGPAISPSTLTPGSKQAAPSILFRTQPSGQPLTQSIPAEIEGQFEPIVQTSGESLNFSGQVERISATQPIPSMLQDQVLNATPAGIQEEPIQPVETHSILQIISD